METNNAALIALLNRDLDLQLSEKLAEDLLFQELANHVAYLLEYRLEFLMSLCYRLDVKELEVNAVLLKPGKVPVNVALTKLLINRQKARLLTKTTYRQSAIDGIEEQLEW